MGLSRDSYRNPPQPDQLTRDLGERIVDIAHVRRRFGYRRIHDLLRSEFPGVNHKRVYRLYKNANLAVRRRKKVKRPPNERVPLQIARKVNDVWSMDFVSDSLSNGRRIKCLTVADRKLPQIENNMKIEASISLRRRDEEVKVHGEPDCCNLG